MLIAPGKGFRNSCLAASAAAMLAWGTTVNADAYFGIGLGSSKMNDASSALLGDNFDDKDSAAKIFGGFRFNRNMAAEFSYIDFGTFIGRSGATVVDRWEASALDASFVAIAPLGDFSVRGRFGLALWDVDDRFGGTSVNESGAGISYGLSLQYNFTRQFSIRADWAQYADVGDEAFTGQSDLSALTASVIFGLGR